MKYIITILLAGIIGIIFNPEFLAASDSVKIHDLEQGKITETVEVAEVKASVASAPVKMASVASVTPTAPKAGVETKVMNQIKFSWGAQDLSFSDTAKLDAKNGAVKVNKMIYGHDYTAFGKITGLKIGDTFSVTINGVQKKYRVAGNPIDGTRGVAVKVVNANRGELYHEKIGNFYTNALENGWKHDLALLTCHNGGRYIVVADEM